MVHAFAWMLTQIASSLWQAKLLNTLADIIVLIELPSKATHFNKTTTTDCSARLYRLKIDSCFSFYHPGSTAKLLEVAEICTLVTYM